MRIAADIKTIAIEISIRRHFLESFSMDLMEALSLEPSLQSPIPGASVSHYENDKGDHALRIGVWK